MFCRDFGMQGTECRKDLQYLEIGFHSVRCTEMKFLSKDLF
jgi:hypothetical protein